ncbi:MULTISPECIES: LuxR C-terminal-related transcriptional regulator [Brucella]|uniref:HTH-type quorum sensing-dependent transcriptional regulator VjbR n=4 Tax=Brucella TaxID=234 RepID=A6WWP1_BRUA4|nr:MULTISPECIES: LuxR C-terminal-related transcriptional regulator [Brucella]ABS13395.1 regulatory protein LuxR [Brucella anthropi ATCC 49188]AIK44176.1 bacterial regulatory s, luxR family protein [Brucella anthropi]KAB2701712.1 LuxR family transcriptional regulator [Brucella lupini]KAB2740667.1 LuxR family transcriptional regulator [Brucella anthropi]KAB2749571.1 LuxR family transcriptional regulator [Brucella anthropi]
MQKDGVFKKSNRKLLTSQERIVLYWTAEGKTRWEISIILGVAETTVVTHLRNSRIKLGATNKTHAVVEAIRHSEISVFNKSHGFAPQGSGPFPLATKHGANTNGGSRAPLFNAARFHRLSESIANAQSPEQFFGAIDKSCAVLGFDAVILSCHKSTKESLLLDPTYCTIPLDVMREYKRLNWIESDVLLAQLIGGNRAFVWDSTYDRYRDIRSQSFLNFLKRFRLVTGILVPLEDEEGFRSFVAFHAYLERDFDINTVKVVREFGMKAKKKAAELGL